MFFIYVVHFLAFYCSSTVCRLVLGVNFNNQLFFSSHIQISTQVSHTVRDISLYILIQYYVPLNYM